MENKLKEPAVFWGNDIGALCQKLDERGATRVLLVTGGDSYVNSGAESFVSPVLQGRNVERFCSFSPNSSVRDLLCGLEAFSRFEPDCLVAVGGGSVIDMAKLINFFGTNGLEPSRFFDSTESSERVRVLPLVAVPTTAGAGSEATEFAVVYRNGQKHSVDDPALLPDVAVLNPDLTASLSPYQTACSGFDAFAQAVESYWAVGSTEQSRQNSRRAIELSLEHLEPAVKKPTPEHRKGMMEAAYLAGKAIAEAKTTAAHALSYVLTARYGLPHGHAVAMMLPSVFETNAAVSRETVSDPRGVEHVHAMIRELCSSLGCISVEEAVESIRCLKQRIGLTNSWVVEREVNVAEMFDCMVREVNVDRLSNNPRRLDEPVLREIVESIKD